MKLYDARRTPDSDDRHHRHRPDTPTPITAAETGERVLVDGRSLDPESATWVRELTPGHPNFDDACRRLYTMLTKIARKETARRSTASRINGPELEDLAHQAAADALIRITHKIGEFRGDARFRTWAFKFVILEVSTKIGRHFWRDRRVSPDQGEVNSARAAIGDEPAQQMQAIELRNALAHAIENVLTEHQRRIFVAVAIDKIPIDALAARLGTNRNAIYKSIFDARHNIRAYLTENDYIT